MHRVREAYQETEADGRGRRELADGTEENLRSFEVSLPPKLESPVPSLADLEIPVRSNSGQATTLFLTNPDVKLIAALEHGSRPNLNGLQGWFDAQWTNGIPRPRRTVQA